MIDLPGKLAKAIDKVLKASESIRIDEQALAATEPQPAQETMPAEGDETSTSPAILTRLAQEGGGPQIQA